MRKKKHLVNWGTQRHINHVRQRARQRAWMNLKPEDVFAIGRMIRHGESTFIKAISNARTKHLVIYKGKSLTVMYHKGKKMPVSIYYTKKGNNNGHKPEGLSEGNVAYVHEGYTQGGSQENV